MSIEVLTLIAQAITGIGALAVAAIAFRHTRRMQRLEAINLYIGYWRELNRLYLECDRARNVRARLAGGTPSDEGDLVTLVAIYINQALVAYYTCQFGSLSRCERDEEFRSIWEILVNYAKLTKDLLCSESYPPRFVAMFLNAMPHKSV